MRELIVDNFAGGGGASLGIEWALGRAPDIAINHDAEAVAMHTANHPTTEHYCEDVWQVDPVQACRGRPVALAWFSPDCKHFSKAKGGKPVDKKIRALAWVVIRWARAVRPRVIVLENVEEFEDWGPVLEDGRPCRRRVGLTFRIWIGKLRALGYQVEWRELVAADYGAPTTRKRLFLIARCDGRPIVWPEPTHGPGRARPWRTAAECIDWSLPTYSIFLTPEEAKRYGVRRPLAENTQRRIARGLKKFVLDNPQPFIVPYYGGGRDRAHDLGEPMRTIVAEPRYSLVAPYLTRIAQTGGNGGYSNDLRDPLTTVVSKAEHLVLAPYFVSRYGEDPDPRRGGGAGQEPRARSVELPMPTIVPTQNGAQLVAAFLAKHFGGNETPGWPLGKPMSTITERDHHALISSSLVKLKGTARHGQQIELPLHTIQAGGNHYAEVRAFFTKFYGSSVGQILNEPAHTTTTKARFGLVTVHGENYVLSDIGMRMLAPRELYRAQGFPNSYEIAPVVDGKALSKEGQVRMCGNSVPPPMVAALASAIFPERDEPEEVAA